MNAVMKLSFATCLFTLFSYNAIAEDTPDKSNPAVHGENRNLTPEQRSEARKEMREHVKENTTPEQRKEMHKRVKEKMVKERSHGNGDMTPQQRSEARKEMREHVKENTTPEQRKEMHKRVIEQMENKSDSQSSKPDTKPAN